MTRGQKEKTINGLMTCAAILHPLTASPQVYEIYASRDASGVSLLTWLGFMILGLVFLTYGIFHGLKPYILAQVLWFIVDLLIIIGILIYS